MQCEVICKLVVKRIMRFLLLLFPVFVYSNTILAQSISLSLNEEPIEKAFSIIEAQTNFRFIYSKETVRKARPVSVQVSKVSLSDALMKLFTGQPLIYSVEDEYIMVKAKEIQNPSSVDVKGRVVDEEGNGLKGVNVVVEGSSKGTTTNENGEFYLPAVDANAVIEFSFVGRETLQWLVKGKSNFTVSLKTVSKALDETIIQAYGTTTKRLNTGNISKISAADISKQPVSNVLAAMEGRVPGLIISQTSGVPGSSFKIQLRGQSSIGSDPNSLPFSEPLFIIDGIPYLANSDFLNRLSSVVGNPTTQPGKAAGISPLSTINPADIESIEILKDADATAIYGSRGANGVIIITTKRGMAGKTTVNLNVQSGISRISRSMNMLNTQQYLQMRREAFSNDGIIPDAINAPDLTVFDTTSYTDFRKLFMGETAKTTFVQASVSGGDANNRFMLSGGHHFETTVFPGDMGDKRESFLVNLDHNSSNNRFGAAFNANYAANSSNLIANNLASYINLPPDYPSFFTPEGKLAWSYKGVALANPFSYLLYRYSLKTDNLVSNLQLRYNIFSGLTIRSNFGYSTTQTGEFKIVPIAGQNPANGAVSGTSDFANSLRKNWIIEPQVNYDQKLMNGKLSVLLGGTWQEMSKDVSSASGTGYVNDDLLLSLGSAGSVTAFNSFAQYRYQAFFGRFNYNWQNRYILNLTGRRDGSSRFGPGKRFHNFGAVGAAWIFSNEPFFKKAIPLVSYGKLRGSYGTTGTDATIGDYKYLESWQTASSSSYQGIGGLYPTQLFNPNYHWELNRKLEGSVELGFFGDRLLAQASFFLNRSGNTLVSYPLPIQTGFSSVTENLPALIQNKGWEFVLSSRCVSTKNFTWTSALNATIHRNKLVSFPGISQTGYATRYVEGQSLNVIYKYQFLGVDPVTGVYQFRDVDNNGNRDLKDFVAQGNLDPKIYGGLQNTFKYRGLEIDIFLEFRKQLGLNYLASQTSYVGGSAYNQPVLILDRWTKSGQPSAVQKLTTTSVLTPAYFAAAIELPTSNGIYSDASFIRGKTIAVSYSIPDAWKRKLHAQNARVYLQSQNLFTITSYKGADPETQSLYSLPPLKTITAGIQFTF